MGLGLYPRRDQTGTTVDAVTKFMIETEIKISAEAFGGFVLASGTENSPQSNPIGFILYTKTRNSEMHMHKMGKHLIILL